MLMDMSTTPEQMATLVRVFARSLVYVSGDDRAFHGLGKTYVHPITDLTKLVQVCQERELTRIEFMSALRQYLTRHLAEFRCVDNVITERQIGRASCRERVSVSRHVR